MNLSEETFSMVNIQGQWLPLRSLDELRISVDGKYMESLDILHDDGIQFVNLAVAGRAKMYTGYEKHPANPARPNPSTRLSLVQMKRGRPYL